MMIICPICKNETTLKRPFCLYCGSEIPQEYINRCLKLGLVKKGDESKYPFVDYQLDEDYIEDYE